MPAGGSPSEFAFSATTEMVTKKRNNLGDDTLERLLVVRHYLRSKYYNFITLVNHVQAWIDKLKLEEAADSSSDSDSD